MEKKYFAKFTPLYQKRAKIVNGEVEPTNAEIEAGKDDEEDEDAEAGGKTEESEAASGEEAKGIPEFWLSAMKNQISVAELITDRDEAALRSLTDIRMEYLDKPGFKLIFEFATNDFFTNKTISKTYHYNEENGYGGDFIYDHAEGDKIDWKTGKDLTVRVESKKQRNKSKPSQTVVIVLLLTIQTPSKLVLSRRLCPPSLSSTSSRPQPRPQMTMKLPLTLRSVSSLTTNSARISKRNLFRELSIGSPERLLLSKNLMTPTRKISRMTKMMKTTMTRRRMPSLTRMMRRKVASHAHNKTHPNARTSNWTCIAIGLQ